MLNKFRIKDFLIESSVVQYSQHTFIMMRRTSSDIYVRQITRNIIFIAKKLSWFKYLDHLCKNIHVLGINVARACEMFSAECRLHTGKFTDDTVSAAAIFLFNIYQHCTVEIIYPINVWNAKKKKTTLFSKPRYALNTKCGCIWISTRSSAHQSVRSYVRPYVRRYIRIHSIDSRL